MHAGACLFKPNRVSWFQAGVSRKEPLLVQARVDAYMHNPPRNTDMHMPPREGVFLRRMCGAPYAPLKPSLTPAKLIEHS